MNMKKEISLKPRKKNAKLSIMITYLDISKRIKLRPFVFIVVDTTVIRMVKQRQELCDFTAQIVIKPLFITSILFSIKHKKLRPIAAILRMLSSQKKPWCSAREAQIHRNTDFR